MTQSTPKKPFCLYRVVDEHDHPCDEQQLGMVYDLEAGIEVLHRLIEKQPHRNWTLVPALPRQLQFCAPVRGEHALHGRQGKS